MFDIFFGWRKASKCKKLIKRVQCRLKLLKNKRFTIVKQLREDLAQLIKLGYQQTAFNRAEQLLKDENIMAVYEILDHFCEFVNIQLSYIRRHKDCPNDINESVSSLIFASARCADLPELPAIRKLFGERYGHRFTTVAVELLPGNLVNREIQEKLSPKSVSDDVKYRLIDEIARDYCLQPEILALEYFPELQHQTSDGSEKEGKNIQVDPLAKTATHLISQCHSYSYPNSDTIGASLTCSPPDDIKAENRNISRICTTTRKRKDDDERIKAPSSSETLPQFCEEVVVYLDDIEELRSSRRKEADCQDQRLFKFKSLSMPTKGVVVDGTDGDDESYTDNVEDEKPSSNANNSRRRSFSLEPSSMKDIDHEIYYENHKQQSHHYRKHQKKTVAERKEATYLLKRSKQPGCTELRGYIQANTLNSEVKTYILFWLWKDGAWAHRLPRVYTFSTTDVGKILRIPLARTPHEDLLVWGGEHSGEFSIHSAYKLLQKSNEIPRAYPLQTNYGNFYKKLWRLNLPTKIKIIVWRISWNYFPKKVNMQHRKLVSSNYP